jgi:hypothetical protein
LLESTLNFGLPAARLKKLRDLYEQVSGMDIAHRE